MNKKSKSEKFRDWGYRQDARLGFMFEFMLKGILMTELVLFLLLIVALISLLYTSDVNPGIITSVIALASSLSGIFLAFYLNRKRVSSKQGVPRFV